MAAPRASGNKPAAEIAVCHRLAAGAAAASRPPSEAPVSPVSYPAAPRPLDHPEPSAGRAVNILTARKAAVWAAADTLPLCPVASSASRCSSPSPCPPAVAAGVTPRGRTHRRRRPRRSGWGPPPPMPPPTPARSSTSTALTRAGDAQPGRQRRPGAGLRAQQPEQHRRRDQPADDEGGGAVPHRRPAPARDAGLGPARRSTSTTTWATASRRSTPAPARPGRPIPVADPYNLYFTPNGRYAIVVAERLQRLDFRDPARWRWCTRCRCPRAAASTTWTSPPSGRYAYASCEFAGRMIEVDLRDAAASSARSCCDDGDASPRTSSSPRTAGVYVADRCNGGVWEIDPAHVPRARLPAHRAPAPTACTPAATPASCTSPTGWRARSPWSASAPGASSRTWQLPLPASPDMGGVSADGRTLWLSGRYNAVVYAINTRTGRLRAAIPVGDGPHGLCVWPQPGALLPRPHRDHALSPRQARAASVRSGPAGDSALTSGDYAAAGASVAGASEAGASEGFSEPSMACGSPAGAPATAICTLRGAWCSGLGTVTSSTPLSKLAATAAGSTPSGRVSVRRKEP